MSPRGEFRVDLDIDVIANLLAWMRLHDVKYVGDALDRLLTERFGQLSSDEKAALDAQVLVLRQEASRAIEQFLGLDA